jgi:hypothetical protein
MSMSHDTALRPDDRLVTIVSAWLAGHLSEGELRKTLDSVRRSELAPDQVEAVDELRAALGDGARGGELQMVARETLEALALGG